MPHDCAKIELNSELIYFLPIYSFRCPKSRTQVHTDTGYHRMSKKSFGWLFSQNVPCIGCMERYSLYFGKARKEHDTACISTTLYRFGNPVGTGSL